MKRIIFISIFSLLVLTLINHSVFAEDLLLDDFTNASLWELTGIENAERVDEVSGQTFSLSDKTYNGHLTCALDYNFTTEGEDSALITRALSDIPMGINAKIKIAIYGDGSGHTLFLVLKEKGGENHFVKFAHIYWNGWKELIYPVHQLFYPPSNPETIINAHWGGNDNQFFNSPLSEITIGVSDVTDEVVEGGVIYFGELRVERDLSLVLDYVFKGYGTEVVDSSSYDNDGTLVNMDPDACWVDGKIGKALEFDGVDDYVNCGNDASLDITDEITIEAWFNTSYTGSRAYLMEKLIGGWGYNTGYGILMSYGAPKLILGLGGEGTNYHFHCTTNLADGEWHHIVFTAKDNNETKAYIDGSLYGSPKSFSDSMTTNTKNLAISTGIWQAFNGSIDEVRIYSRALTEDEVYQRYLEADNPGLWKLDEGEGTSANDSSGNANHGTLMNMDTDSASPDFCWVDGKIGKALEFDGIDDYVNCGNAASLDIRNEITIETWVYLADDPDTTPENDFRMIVGKPSHCPYGMLLEQNRHICVNVYNTSIARYVFWTDYYLPIGEWHHLAYTYESSTGEMKFYVDGDFNNSKSFTPDQILTTTGNLYISNPQGSSDRAWIGTIDEVRIYSRALTADEIYQHYLEGDTRGNWKFDEGEGTTAADSSSNGNDGTLTNMDPDTCWVDGKIGKALEFDGVNDWVNCGKKDSLNFTNALTLEAWVKPNVIPTGDNYITILYRAFTDSPYYSYLLRIGYSKIYFQVVTSSGGVSSKYSITTPNIWHHLVGTYDGENVRLYVDGSLEDYDPQSGNIVPQSSYVQEIARGGINGKYFNGLIDEVRIYSRALTADEIYQHYLEGGGS